MGFWRIVMRKGAFIKFDKFNNFGGEVLSVLRKVGFIFGVYEIWSFYVFFF